MAGDLEVSMKRKEISRNGGNFLDLYLHLPEKKFCRIGTSLNTVIDVNPAVKKQAETIGLHYTDPLYFPLFVPQTSNNLVTSVHG